jgi:hypothetical protein
MGDTMTQETFAAEVRDRTMRNRQRPLYQPILAILEIAALVPVLLWLVFSHPIPGILLAGLIAGFALLCLFLLLAVGMICSTATLLWCLSMAWVAEKTSTAAMRAARTVRRRQQVRATLAFERRRQGTGIVPATAPLGCGDEPAPAALTGMKLLLPWTG